MSTVDGLARREVELRFAADAANEPELYEGWEQDAACRDLVAWPSIFAPTTPKERIVARAICATCGVTYQCLILGLSTAGNEYMLYGGLDQEERRALTLTPQIEQDVARMETMLDAAEPWSRY